MVGWYVSLAVIYNHPGLIQYRVAVVFAVQSWLAESAEQRATSTTPGYFSVGMACKFAFGDYKYETANS
jgi:hypothetical protein